MQGYPGFRGNLKGSNNGKAAPSTSQLKSVGSHRFEELFAEASVKGSGRFLLFLAGAIGKTFLVLGMNRKGIPLKDFHEGRFFRGHFSSFPAELILTQD